MAMNFGEHVDVVQKLLGDHSGETELHIKRWVNDARNYLWEQIPGNYKEAVDYLTTTVAYTTGTVATDGTTAVVGTDTVWTSAMAGRFLQIAGTDPWYRIASVESTTGLTLGDGSPEFPVNETVILNLSGEAFADPTLNTSIGISFFPTLP